MAIKESRKELIESGSALVGHSMNQKKIKMGDEGGKRLANTLGVVQIEETGGQPENFDSLKARLPLGETFVDAVLPFMIDLARQRVAVEQDLPIPARIANIVRDVKKVYGVAKSKGLSASIIDEVALEKDKRTFNLRRNVSLYPGLFPYQLFLIEFKKLPNWRFLSGSEVQIWIDWGRAYVLNLTSCDFTLTDRELVAERIVTIAYVLSTVGIMTGAPSIKKSKMEVLVDRAFNIFLGVSEKHFQRLKA